MAFSQVQCLDDSHVNWRSSESKPEFFYSEEQRLALEALASRGPDAFYEVLKKENIRDFLSELELKKILDTLETYDPGSEYIPHHGSNTGESEGERNSQGDEQDVAPSLEYWPQRSDRSIPQLDLGWPETIAYRGVTRATVYMQPPIEGQAHIKEVVRKMICQAQKVIAVVMDMFTDVDIFKDLLDAGFKRKVGVYIILDETNVKHFLQMCERAQMHAGHLKNLRVRSTGGTEFFTRSATKFKGALAQKFMFVDGDRAMCGSYSFTWSAARTDRNVITVLSGQVVEAFDKQFQELYLMSKGVSLKSISMGEEPEPEPVTLPSVVPVTPANAVVKKLINPKYALVKAKSADQISKTSSENQDKNQKTDNKGKALPEGQGGDRHGDMADLSLLIHPGLLNLEKANMFDYLPTWVEPDPEPGSEVLGYINIIDPKIKNVKLSQMNRIKVCDVSQASAQHRQMLKNREMETKKNSDQEPPLVSPCQRQTLQTTMEAPAAPATSPVEGTSWTMRQAGTFTASPLGHRLKPPEETTEDIKPPVPKPRTVPVGILMTKVITPCDSGVALEGDTQPPPADQTAAKQEPEENPNRTSIDTCYLQPDQPVAGPQEDKGPPCAHNGLGEEEEEEEEEYITLSDQESYSSSSADHSYRRSNASSISDEYFEVRDRYGPLRRTNSDVTHNGEILPMQRKLSDPHISRGTFLSPLGSLPSLKHVRMEDVTKRRSNAVEIRCVLPRTILDGNSSYPSSTTQGTHIYRYRPRNPVGREQVKEVSCSPTHEKPPGATKYRGDGAEPKKTIAGSQPYWQSKAFSPSKPTQPGHLSPNNPRATSKRLTSLPESQKTTEEMRTPLGIPLSKLSQSKHLKNRVAGTPGASTDSKKKPPETTSQKEH
ncbi:LOW QUALITY PROTEIN: protein FAM83G [Falco peregrinus]|uniref:LOW QUALITY PROTEIN: protein FAM83G n=1 Tax=Falco peregrinus TaxID=8954 RepID=UPI00247A609B|nr:LOW QUALITY PROTEIN: protein FAM83G [Falco peregrinus]